MSILWIIENNGSIHELGDDEAHPYNLNAHRSVAVQTFKVTCRVCGFETLYYGDTDDVLCGIHHNELMNGHDDHYRPAGEWAGSAWALEEKQRIKETRK